MRKLVNRWLRGKDREAVAPRVPDGQRVYCIGDIHGRLDLLDELLRKVDEDACEFEGARILVYLGDYIDRGPQSREVIDRLLEEPLAGFEVIHLLGNHEQTLLDFLAHPHSVGSWLAYGGIATLASYGVHAGPGESRSELGGLRDSLEQRLPDAHRRFLEELKLLHVCGSYCFVHAGIRPGVPLQEQRNDDLLWIRDEFTRSSAVHPHVIVHGHTITPSVEFLPNRIGIDTGAFHTGILTCLVLEADTQRLLQTGIAAV
ncbi:metallophosphoesterase family protein [Elongatibacter sediminis]|uniref:Metallophosphoesterase family protein n=1 Tax=Elongatibacter sediminis TaxID=3119006 RepID=A0AAW9RAG6_9GAMM